MSFVGLKALRLPFGVASWSSEVPARSCSFCHKLKCEEALELGKGVAQQLIASAGSKLHVKKVPIEQWASFISQNKHVNN